METTTCNSVQEAYNLGYEDGFHTAKSFVTRTRYVKERTCSRVIRTNARPGKTVCNQWYACSECERPMSVFDRYCSHCGAKVIFREDTDVPTNAKVVR